MAREKWIASDQDRGSQNRIINWSVLWVGVFLIADTVIETLDRGRRGGDLGLGRREHSRCGLGWLIRAISQDRGRVGSESASRGDGRGTGNWTQADLAERARVSRQTINAIETGKFDPSLPLAFTIARIFEMTIEEVFEPE